MDLLGLSLYWVILISIASAQNISYSTKYYDVLLDHFNFLSNKTFKLRYLENDEYWNKDGGPIFFYTGNEGDIITFAQNTGFMWELAPQVRALLVFAEHRYYGESLPFGNLSFTEPKYSGFLSSSQALADYVDLISYIKKSHNVTMRNPPVIAFGGSYGGMLAAWIRMKYPAVIQGSLASSAPIWQFTGMTVCSAFNRVTSAAYSSTSEYCSISIRNSWAVINKMGSTDTGRTWLSKNFKLCSPLKTADDPKKLKDWLNDVYVNLAMTNYPYPNDFLAHLPANPVKVMCKSLQNPGAKDEVLLSDVFNAVSVYFNGTGNAKCLNLDETSSIGQLGWDYQSCTEMVMPMCDDGKTDMFEENKWDIEKVSNDCYNRFKVRPQVYLAEKEYGGRNIGWASNIIFSNGLLDPWASGGVLKNVSETAVAIIIPESAHHLDLRFSDPADPFSVIAARKFYRRTIRRWIHRHNYGSNLI